MNRRVSYSFFKAFFETVREIDPRLYLLIEKEVLRILVTVSAYEGRKRNEKRTE